jgi:hypothetical protein
MRPIFVRSLCAASKLAYTMAILAALAVPMLAQVYTTTASGANVNANIYANKADVYLSGGPTNFPGCNQNGLAVGTYYFQVTTPNGNLLSTDTIGARKVEVGAGQKVISNYIGNPLTHLVSASTSPCGSKLVQLLPYDDTTNAGGEYKLWLFGPNCSFDSAYSDASTALLGTALTGCQSKTDNFKVRQETGCEPMCSDPTPVAIFGTKFYDANLNGVQDGEPGIAGWRIEKEPPTPRDITYTDVNGIYGFLVQPNSGMYTISEVFPAGPWLATTPLSGQVTVLSVDVAGPNFGNVCLGPGGGMTLGFWSNKNGQALFGPDDLALMASLNLRDANGNPFDPANYAAFRTWILAANATNMAYMLSAQLAAMELNVLNGKVNGSALIYAPGTTGANALGFASVNAVMMEANTSLGTYGSTPSGHSERAHQTALKDALDKANNNLNFLQPGPQSCPFITPY